MTIKRQLALALVLLLLAACGKQATVPPPDTEPPPTEEPIKPNTVPLQMAATIDVLNIYDERSGVGEEGRILHMPESSIVGKKWDLKPELLASQRQLIEQEIRSSFAPGTRRVEIDVYVLDGYQSYEAQENLYEEVLVRFGLRVEIGDAVNIHEVWIGEGDASITVNELEVSRDSVDNNYAEVIRQSVVKAFAQIKETQ